METEKKIEEIIKVKEGMLMKRCQGGYENSFAVLLWDSRKRRIKCQNRIWYVLKAKQARICWSLCRNTNTEKFSLCQTLQFHSLLATRNCRYRERAGNQQLGGHLVNVSLLWLFTEQFIQYASCLYAPSEVHIFKTYRDARPLDSHIKSYPLWIKMV